MIFRNFRGLGPWTPSLQLLKRSAYNHTGARSTSSAQTSRPARFLTPKRVEGFSRITFLSAATLLSVHVFAEYFYECNGAYGISMLPTFASFGDWPITSKYYRRGRDVHVGDVVSFKHPVRQREHAIKRIIGLEGDFVLMNTPGRSDTMIQVPQGHCWVVGDNLEHSRDSRTFGPLPVALISGKVVAKWNVNTWTFSKVENTLQPAPSEGDAD